MISIRLVQSDTGERTVWLSDNLLSLLACEQCGRPAKVAASSWSEDRYLASLVLETSIQIQHPRCADCGFNGAATGAPVLLEREPK